MAKNYETGIYDGYQAAMTDLVAALEQGGVEKALTWILDNARTDADRAHAAVTKALLSRPTATRSVTVTQTLGVVESGATAIGYRADTIG